MLNPAFPQKYLKDCSGYQAQGELANIVLTANAEIATHPECRLQSIYTHELVRKFASIGIDMGKLNGLKILDLCCGTGFLSFHILKKSPHAQIRLIDISQIELFFAKKLLKNYFPKASVEFLSIDADSLDMENHFDIIVGNSYLHHFIDPTESIRNISHSLKPGGIFVTLHEPLVTALGWESGSLALAARLFLQPQKTIERLRHIGNSPKTAQDVWVFTHKDLWNIFAQSGLVDIRSSPWGMFRPLIAAKYKLQLSPSKSKLNVKERMMLQSGIQIDTILSRCCSREMFGSCTIRGNKPQ